MKTIPRPYKSPWTYAISWRAGDDYIGRRWAVVNISHNLIICEFSLEIDAKRAARDLRKRHDDARRAANRIAKGAKPIREPNKKQIEWLNAKLAAHSFKHMPFPA
jgi:hypothetical protein